MLTITSRTVAVNYRTTSDVKSDDDLTQIPSFTSMLIRDVYLKSKKPPGNEDNNIVEQSFISLEK